MDSVVTALCYEVISLTVLEIIRWVPTQPTPFVDDETSEVRLAIQLLEPVRISPASISCNSHFFQMACEYGHERFVVDFLQQPHFNRIVDTSVMSNVLSSITRMGNEGCLNALLKFDDNLLNIYDNDGLAMIHHAAGHG
eukprot:PhF_6_TR28081/c1_g1_i2/m.41489